MTYQDDNKFPKEGSWDEMFPEWPRFKNEILVPLGLLVITLIGLWFANQ
jgi:hypothetical protein